MRYAWLRIPWLVPSRFTSWTPLPWVVVSKRYESQVSARHVRHELQHLRDMQAWLILYPVVWVTLWVLAWLNGRDTHYDHAWEVRARMAGAEIKVHTPSWWRVAGVASTVLVLIWAANTICDRAS